MLRHVLLIVPFLPGCVARNVDEQASIFQSNVERRAIPGIWWSTDVFQSAAFHIKDSTIYYPENVAEYEYVLTGDSLFIHRENGYVSSSFIARVTADTLVLMTSEKEETYTNPETNVNSTGWSGSKPTRKPS